MMSNYSFIPTDLPYGQPFEACVARENDLKGSRILSSLQARSTSRRKLRRSSWRSIPQTLWMTNVREESKPLNEQVREPYR